MSYDCYGRFPLQFLIKIIEIWPMTAMGNFHYNSLSKSLKYDLWLLWAISFTTPYQNPWNMTCDCNELFPLQFLIKIIEMWPVKAMGHFNYRSLSKSLKCEIWHLWAIATCSFLSIPYQNHSKFDVWQLWTISITIPYQNHWDMTYDSYGAFPLQFLIKIIEIWPMTAMGNFL